MPRQAELQEPWALTDSHGRPITRGRVVFAFWALAAMTLVCRAVVIWFTRDTLAGRDRSRRRSPRCERTQLPCGHAEIQKQHSRTTRDSRLKAFQYPVVDPAL
jgi:hypothetical protein